MVVRRFRITKSLNHEITRSQLSEGPCEQAQCPPCDLHDGIASVSRRPAVPTMPGDDSSFCRSSPWHDGQDAAREAVTKASKCRPHPRHAYSNMGMGRFYQGICLAA